MLIFRGFAHGTLLKDEIYNVEKNFEIYAEHGLDQYLKFLPESIRHVIERLGIKIALDLTWYATR
jgi:uncharacterized protein YktB (UPF0637 family)